MKIVKSGSPELKDRYLPQNAASKFPPDWWVGIQMDCFCGATFVLETGDAVEERSDCSIIHCPHCKIPILLPRGDYPIVEFSPI